MENKKQGRVAVIGCGASGMSTAFHLFKEGVEVDVFEKEASIGGRMSTKTLNGKEICIGGRNIGNKYDVFRAFCDSLEENEFGDFASKVHQHSDKDVKSFDSSNKLKSMINSLRDLTFKDMRRMFPIMMAVKKNPENAYISGPYFKKFTTGKNKGVKMDPYFSEKLQAQLRPLTVRVNGSEPHEVPLASFGTMISMILDSYEQLTNGHEKLFSKFQEKVNVQTNTNVKQLLLEGEDVKGFVTEEGVEMKYDHVVLATPAYISAKILSNTHVQISEMLDTIPYNPIGVVVAEYERPYANKERVEFGKESVLSSVGYYGNDNTKLIRYSFSGTEARKLLEQKKTIAELAVEGEKEVEKYTDEDLGKNIGSVGQILPRGLCAYSADHQILLENITKEVRQIQGLQLAGDYIEGVSIEGCFRSGKKASEELIAEGLISLN